MNPDVPRPDRAGAQTQAGIAPAPGAATAGTPAPADAEGTVYDLGYAPHEGPRLGRPAAIRAMAIDGARRALGLRRKAWSKALPWGLIAAAIVPAAWTVALSYVVAGFTLEDAGPWGDPAEFFVMIGTLTMLFVGLVAPTLLIPDRQHGVLAIYASRPVRAVDYLLARALTLFVLTSLFMLVPHAILYVGISGLYVDGFAAGLVENGKEIPAILGTALAYVVAYGAPAFLIALLVQRVPIASGAYVLIMFMSAVVIDVFPRATDLLVFKVIAPLTLFWNPLSVRDWLFDQEPDGWPLSRVGLEPWVGGATILVVAVATALIAHRRYRREF